MKFKMRQINMLQMTKKISVMTIKADEWRKQDIHTGISQWTRLQYHLGTPVKALYLYP
jgi:hypothetical protein